MTRDARLVDHRRAFAEGDFSEALRFVSDLRRAEDQVERLAAAFERAQEAAEWRARARSEGMRPFTLEDVREQISATAARAVKHGVGWGWRWSGTVGRVHGTEPIRGTALASATVTPGWKLIVAAFGDAKLGVVAVGVRAALGTESIVGAWKGWRGCSSRVRPAGLVENLTRWALADSERDRAFFVLPELNADLERLRLRAYVKQAPGVTA